MVFSARRARPVSVLAAHKLRAGWRAWAALAVLIAITGGAVLAAVAGAIRTDTAYPRFLAASQAADVLVAPAGTGLGGYLDALSRLPQAAATAPIVGLQVLPMLPDGTPDGAATTVVAPDGRYGHLLEIPRLLAGRLPDQGNPAEIGLSVPAARRLHATVGALIPMGAYSSDNPPKVRKLTERVVGIFLDRGSVIPVNQLDNASRILATTALWHKLGADYEAFDGAYARLKPGASLAAYSAAAQRLTRKYPLTGGQVFVSDENAQAATVERAIRPQAIALALFAAALALTALLVVGHVAARVVDAAAGDNAALAALGMTRRQLFAASLVQAAAVSAAGALGAVVLAIAASPLTPIGPARVAEPSPGMGVNGQVLAIGGAVIIALMLGRVTVSAWRRASTRPAGLAGGGAPPSASGRSRLADRLADAGAPLTAVTGLRFAFGGKPGHVGGQVASGVRSVLVGLAVAVAAVAAAVTFGANLARLADTPRLYGQDWQASLDVQFGTFTPAQFDRLTARLTGIAGVTFGVHGTVTIGDTVIAAIGLAPGRGPLTSSTILAGRPPHRPDEIVLGTSVLRDHGLKIGQRVKVTAGHGVQPMRITGSAVFPYFGQGSFSATDAGFGAETAAEPLAAQAAAAGGAPGYNFALISFTPGPAEAANLAAFQRALAPYCESQAQSTCVITDQRPNTVNNYAAIDATPAVLAGVLAVLATGVLAQFILASARRRRRDFAVLKVLGMARGQLRAVAFWQVAVVTAVALSAGLPLGVAAGRWAWRLFTGQVGLPADAITPLPVLWMIPVTLALAALIALPPARSVARVPAAVALRSE
jgi:ABC-type antimicrobial peptide transport system permease subunit